MPRPCPDDLRMHAAKKVLAGESRCSVAKQIGVAVSTVIKWVRQYLETGSAGPRQMGGYRKPKLAGRRTWILERIKACPAVTLAGLQSWLRELDVSASVAAIWRFLRSCGITRKKLTPVADERNRPDVERRCKRWKLYQGKADPRKLVFIDETWTKTNMSPAFGWGPKGQRVQGWAPFGHWGTSTFIAALRHDRIDAPWVMDGPVNGDALLLHVETQLVPTPGRGDIAVMDNLGSHKTRAVRTAIRGARATCCSFRLQSRSQSDRAGVRQTQALPAQGPAADPGRSLEKHRLDSKDIQTRRMRQLSRELRIWSTSN